MYTTLHAFTVKSIAYRIGRQKFPGVPQKRIASFLLLYTIRTVNPPTLRVHILRFIFHACRHRKGDKSKF